MENKITASNVNLYYGQKQALFGVNINFKENRLRKYSGFITSKTNIKVFWITAFTKVITFIKRIYLRKFKWFHEEKQGKINRDGQRNKH